MRIKSRILAYFSVLFLICFVHTACYSVIDPEARKQFFNDVGDMTLTIYPTFVREAESSFDSSSAKRLGDYIEEKELATVTLSSTEFDPGGGWESNQARMFQDSALSFASSAAVEGFDTQYALMAEFLMSERLGVGGIHCYVVDSQGRVAFGVGLNSHHEVFSTRNPQTVADCVDVLIKALEKELDLAP